MGTIRYVITTKAILRHEETWTSHRRFIYKNSPQVFETLWWARQNSNL